MKILFILTMALGAAAVATAPLSQAVPEATASRTMRAAAMDRYGGPEVLTVHFLPIPAVKPGEVLIAVHWAAVSSWDKDLRAHPLRDYPAKLPLVLGVDGAGTIAAAAPDVQGFKVGDRVYAYQWDIPSGGFYAEYVAIAAKSVGHMPGDLSFRDAAAIGVEGLTALQGIDDALHLRPRQTLVIHGASGGVGIFAVQFAKLRGARVLATASGEDGMAFVKKLGADAVVDGRHGDIPAAIHAFAPDGVDAVLGLAGGEPLQQCANALRSGGLLAYPHGFGPPPHVGGQIKVVGYDAIAGPAEFERLNQAIKAAHLQIPIAAEFSLAQAAQAHEKLDAGHVLGRIVLRVR